MAGRSLITLLKKRVQEPVDGSAREPLFCTQKLTANTAGFEPVIVQTSFLREVILADFPRGSLPVLGDGEEGVCLREKKVTGQNFGC